MRLSPAGPALVVAAAAASATVALPAALAAPTDPAAPSASGAPAMPAAPPASPSPAALSAPGAAMPAAPPGATPTPNAPAPNAAATPAASPPSASDADTLRALRAPRGPAFHLLGTLVFGQGFRFNNPYRLQTQLGESAKTVSLTAPYIDLGAGLAIGDTFGLRHGAALNLSAALSGVGQAVLAPTYLVTYRGASERFLAYGRLGPVILLSPDTNVGGELGLGGAVYVTAKTAVTASVVGDLFYGAATRETGYPVYPVVSLQLGLLFDHEVLP